MRSGAHFGLVCVRQRERELASIGSRSVPLDRIVSDRIGCVRAEFRHCYLVTSVLSKFVCSYSTAISVIKEKRRRAAARFSGPLRASPREVSPARSIRVVLYNRSSERVNYYDSSTRLDYKRTTQLELASAPLGCCCCCFGCIVLSEGSSEMAVVAVFSGIYYLINKTLHSLGGNKCRRRRLRCFKLLQPIQRDRGLSCIVRTQLRV